jgi:phosphatidylinositol-3-phosphatase
LFRRLVAALSSLAIALTLVVATRGSAVLATTYTYHESGGGNSTAGTTFSANLGSATTAGDSLVVTAGTRVLTGSIATVTQVATYTASGCTGSASDVKTTPEKSVTQGSQAYSSTWLISPVTAGVNCVQITTSLSASIAFSALDVTPSVAGTFASSSLASNSGSSTAPSASAVTGASGDLVVEEVGWNGTMTISGANTGFTAGTTRASTVSGAVNKIEADYGQMAGASSFSKTLSLTTGWTLVSADFAFTNNAPPTFTTTDLGGANSTTDVSSLVAAPSAAVTQGDTILVHVIARQIGGTNCYVPTASVTDAFDGNFTKLISSNGGNTGQLDQSLWMFTQSEGLSTSDNITVTLGSSSDHTGCVGGPFTSAGIAFEIVDVSPSKSGSFSLANSGASSHGTTASVSATCAAGCQDSTGGFDFAFAGVAFAKNTITVSAQKINSTSTVNSATRYETVTNEAAGEQFSWLSAQASSSSYTSTLSNPPTSWTWDAIAGVLVFGTGSAGAPTVTNMVSTDQGVVTVPNGPDGITVQVSGSNFDTETSISFGGSTVTPVTGTLTATSFNFLVPAAMAAGAKTITVTNPSGSNTSSPTYTVVAIPTINYFAPLSGPIGTGVTLNGWLLGTTSATLKFGTTAATIATADGSTGFQEYLTTSVPAGLANGSYILHVTVGANTGDSTGSFTVSSTAAHIMVVMLENRGYTLTIGNSISNCAASPDPWLCGKATSYASMANWYGNNHGSEPNYVQAITGGINGCTADNCFASNTQTEADLGSQLTAQSIPWKAYMETMPADCSTSTTSGLYALKHNSFDLMKADNSPCVDKVMPTAGGVFDTSVLSGSNFVWISPNLCSDMHGSNITGSPCLNDTPTQLVTYGDTWLKNNIGPVLTNAWFTGGNATVIITMDEGDGSACQSGLGTPSAFLSNCGPAGGHVPFVVISNAASGKGQITGTAGTGDQYGLLRTLEKSYGLSFLGDASNVTNGDASPYMGG